VGKNKRATDVTFMRDDEEKKKKRKKNDNDNRSNSNYIA